VETHLGAAVTLFLIRHAADLETMIRELAHYYPDISTSGLVLGFSHGLLDFRNAASFFAQEQLFGLRPADVGVSLSRESRRGWLRAVGIGQIRKGQD
jgi:hypothetical protein